MKTAVLPVEAAPAGPGRALASRASKRAGARVTTGRPTRPALILRNRTFDITATLLFSPRRPPLCRRTNAQKLDKGLLDEKDTRFGAAGQARGAHIFKICLGLHPSRLPAR